MADADFPTTGPRDIALLRLERSRCLRMRYAASTCDRCATVCPSAAIRVEGGIAIEHQSCTSCLTCTTACPSGALEGRTAPERLIGEIASHALPVFVVGCRRSGECHHRLPCLGVLSAEHLVALYASGACLVHLDATGCARCPASAALELLSVHLRDAAGVGGLPLGDRIQIITDPKKLDLREDPVGRRSFFSSLKRLTVRGIAAALVPASELERTSSYSEKLVPVRRRLLLAALDRLSDDDRRHVEETFSFTATFEPSCDGCFGCARACPTGALREDGEEMGVAASPPRFDARRCTGCRLCEEFCLSAALTISRGGRAEAATSGQTQEVARREDGQG